MTLYSIFTVVKMAKLLQRPGTNSSVDNTHTHTQTQHTHTHTHPHTHTHTHILKHTHSHTHAHGNAFKHTHTDMHTNTHVFMCARVCVCVSVFMCTTHTQNLYLI